MSDRNKHRIIVYEHDKLTLQDKRFTKPIFESLQKYFAQQEKPYFKLIYKGVLFSQFVGVIQVGQTVIEVLPKIDRMAESLNGQEETLWRNILIQMLRLTLNMDADSTSSSDLRLRKNSVLDLYLELFISECERIIHQGRTKKYRKVRQNKSMLKGRLDMSRHIIHNSIHKERFYIEFNTYDQNHLVNQLLNEALHILGDRFNSPLFYSRIKNLLLVFEDCDRISPQNYHFENIVYNRKTERYRKAMVMAQLIIMNYHPDILRGSNDVLALMFDMNQLWEGYITRMLTRHIKNTYDVKAQNSKLFWKTDNSYKSIRPDILLKPKENDARPVIIDTKWKVPGNRTPSDEDLRQMFAYNHAFGSNLSILLYPGNKDLVCGKYNTPSEGNCAAVFTDITNDRGELILDDSLLLPIFEVISDPDRNGLH